MGIKGVYKEIGAGARIALMRLAVDSLERRGRPLRLAIDVSIWQFQVQAARGGANPAVRTLFYRLVRLLGLPVQPVFVFDGLNKPLFKRNRRAAGPGDSVATAMAKRMIRLFGFCVHDAPGEAEAECALLQQRGVVDAVLSEDVDTLMFGCTRTLRSWAAAASSNASSSSSSASSSSSSSSSTSAVTHVTLYETDAATATPAAPAALLPTHDTGLDREGLVLVALMSGGDYLPEGVPGCGVKLACEAARAGFGHSLCRIKRSDAPALARWRALLQHELSSNDSRFFRTRHRKLVIPDAFPNLDVLRYYTHPVVSPADVVEHLRAALDAAAATHVPGEPPVDVPGLRAFVAESFDWCHRPGAVKFIRVLAPNLLARILLLGHDASSQSLVEAISRQRTHPSTDDTPELRVAYVPVAVVGLDLDDEPDGPPETSYGRDGLALNSDDEFDEPSAASAPLSSLTVASARRVAATPPYDPTAVRAAWVPRAIVQLGAPDALAAWDQKQQRKEAAQARSSARRKPAAKTGMPAGALDRYVQVTPTAVTTASQRGLHTAAEVEAETEPSLVPPARFKPVPHLVDIDSEDDNVRDGAPPPRRPAGNPWARAGSSRLPRVAKAAAAPPKPAPPATPPAKRATATARRPPANVDVVDLLSSSPLQRDTDGVDGRRSAARGGAWLTAMASSSPPAATFSPLPSSPTRLSPRRRTDRTDVSSPGRKNASSSSPRKAGARIKTADSPRKQASIRDFLAPKPVALAPVASTPVSILLSDTEGGGGDEHSREARPRRAPDDDDPFLSSPPTVAAAAATVKKTTRYIPRASAVGFFREEVAESSADIYGDGALSSARPDRRRRGWRRSEIGVVDLTGKSP